MDFVVDNMSGAAFGELIDKYYSHIHDNQSGKLSGIEYSLRIIKARFNESGKDTLHSTLQQYTHL